MGGALIHYGATVSHPAARYKVFTDADPEDIWEFREAAFGSPSAREPASAQQVELLLGRLEEGLHEGALGIGFGITYTPGASHEEIFRAFQVAAELDAPCFVHMRSSQRMDGDRLAPIQEVVSNVAATGGALHIVHINSSTNESVREAMELIRAARANGVDVTTEVHPYTAGSTLIENALFDDWRGDYDRLQWAATGERLTEETFRRYREQGGMVIIHGRREPTNEWITRQPDIILASDVISFRNGPAHPRGAGCLELGDRRIGDGCRNQHETRRGMAHFHVDEYLEGRLRPAGRRIDDRRPGFMPPAGVAQRALATEGGACPTRLGQAVDSHQPKMS